MFPPFLRRGPNRRSMTTSRRSNTCSISVRTKSASVLTSRRWGYGKPFFDWITHDKGYGRRLTDFGDVINPEGLRTIGELPNLTAAMERRGWPDLRIEKLMGKNWLTLLRTVWGRLGWSASGLDPAASRAGRRDYTDLQAGRTQMRCDSH
jgi:membrane dipeptidase